jgi:hypothetical protein
LKNVPQHFPADSHLKYSGTKTDAVEQCPWVESGCNITAWQVPWFAEQACYRRQLKLHSYFKRVPETLHGRVIRRELWPLHLPDLTPRAFRLWEVLKIKCIGQICTLWRNKETTSGVRFQQLPGMKSRASTTCFAGILTAFGQEGNIVSTCCSTGEFLLDFLKVIVKTNLFLTSVPDF